ncbi:ABC transporter permease subunit [Paraburkholderia silvatlantica]|uniref:ABC-type spermidine/putrescine transport system permease subunit I n=1 Tax=Paraburkholderia silvatlantica TaxID=321895 RepID=A0A2U1A759_9BURK|nr:ABC-type spermidine/putrescine transport system permease subunit I [Paraburkholderia silvatlantica]PVY27901.1 ABC-type spermidine/putrescine transport system permease subunit I [Paraburkholderia silvatlantica]PXW34748.1 ABC-type spermidine/putrescine transport system permease subunit I [Paraburkholderia silvatlantica]PYE20520.1 ABC-type spermidine/putrescine transport system permease subunit I [Paraburkholderia silvatlantica]TDQ98614.1 ABC-type spermidine/putrescine transport system permease
MNPSALTVPAEADRTGLQRQRWRRALRIAAMAAPIVVLLAVFLIYPVGQLLLLSVRDDSGFSLAEYRRLFASPVYVEVLWVTMKISLLTTFFSVLTAYPVALFISTLTRDRKSKVLYWVLLSFWTSFLVRTFAWVVLLGRNGVINWTLMHLGIIDQPLSLLYNLPAVIVGMVHALMPLAILTMLSVMENIDGRLPTAAATLGARPGTVFWKVYFPLSLPGVASSALMVFVTAIGFFITPTLLGGRRQTMITQLIIDQVMQALNWRFAGAISVLLLVVVLAVFVVYDRMVGLSTMAGGSSASGAPHNGRNWSRKAGDVVLTALGNLTDAVLRLVPAPRRRASAGKRRSLRAAVWLILIFLSAPAFLMIPLSFDSLSGLAWPPHGFSLQWYQQVADSPLWMQAVARSLVVGVGTGVLSMAIGTPAAFLLVRGGLKWNAAMLAFVLAPIVVPRMILAVGVFYFFAHIGLVGSSFGLMLAHTVVAVPYVVITMMAVLRNYDVRLDLAAQSMGARRFTTLRRVTFPILGAGLMSSFLFAFATSFDELTIALFASGGLNTTLPKQFWDETTMQISPVIAAVSTCLFVFISVLIAVADRLRRRSLAS